MEYKTKVSIIVPVYNVEKYLRRCMESLINQTYKNIEIIVINDGSSDNSLNILKEYEVADNRIKLINKNNEGLSQTRNVGIEVASGKYITFVDSDDWIANDMIDRMYKLAESEKLDLVISSYIREYKNKSIPKIFNNIEYMKIYNEDDVYKELYRKLVGPIGSEIESPENLDSLVIACGKLYKASLIKEKVKFIDTLIIGTEDCLFNIHVFSQVKKALFINEPLYHYWKGNENSLTTGYRKDLKGKWKRMYLYIENYLKENDDEEIFFEALNNRICLSTMGLAINECSKKNNISELKKIRNIYSILNEEYIRNAFENFNLSKLPIHWRIFYFFNKFRIAFGTYLMIQIIQIFRRLK